MRADVISDELTSVPKHYTHRRCRSPLLTITKSGFKEGSLAILFVHQLLPEHSLTLGTTSVVWVLTPLRVLEKHCIS